MKISQYPAAIAQAAQVVNELDSQIAAVNQHIARLEARLTAWRRLSKV
jgi:uncharacterized small protein (DUF1192 family)